MFIQDYYYLILSKILSEPQVFLLLLSPKHRLNVPGCSGIISSMILWLQVLLLCRFWQVLPSPFDLWKMSSCCHLGKAKCAASSEAICEESCQLAGCLCCGSSLHPARKCLFPGFALLFCWKRIDFQVLVKMRLRQRSCNENIRVKWNYYKWTFAYEMLWFKSAFCFNKGHVDYRSNSKGLIVS